MGIDTKAAEHAIASFLRALGHDPSGDPELDETPARVVEAFTQDLLTGYGVDVPRLLASGSARPPDCGGRGFVVLRDLAVTAVCPHHLLPALGRATVVYVPGTRLLGIGTIASLVDAYARRLTLQETIGDRVAAALVEHAGAQGAACELTLAHSCMNARAGRPVDATVRTLALAGSFTTPEATAELALALGARESAS